MTIKAKKPLSGKEIGKELIRKQMGEWFAESRSKKERFMKNKKEGTPITQEDIDKHVQAFLKKGGTIQKLEPLNSFPKTDSEIEEDVDEFDEINDTNYGLRKILSMKINEMRY